MLSAIERTVFVVALTVFASAASAGPRGAEGMGPGRFPHHPKMTPQQQAVFDACLKENGVQHPPMPNEKDQAAFKACHEQVAKGDRDAFHACLVSKGVNPPTNPSKSDHFAIKDCMKKALGGMPDTDESKGTP